MFRQQFCKRDLDAANLRPALEQSCGEQTLSARKLFFRVNLLCVPTIKMQRRPRSRSVHNFGIAFWEPQRNGKIRFFLRRNTFFSSDFAIGLRFSKRKYRSSLHRPRSRSPLHFDIKNKQQIRSEKKFPSAWRLLSAAVCVRWPQVCRIKITFTKLPTNRFFVSTTKKSMKCVVNWIPLRICARSRNTQPHLNELLVNSN